MPLRKLVLSAALALFPTTAIAAAPGSYSGRNSEAWVFTKCRLDVWNRIISVRDMGATYNFWVGGDGIRSSTPGVETVTDNLTFSMRDAAGTNIYSNEARGIPAGAGHLTMNVDANGKVLSYEFIHAGLDGQVERVISCKNMK